MKVRWSKDAEQDRNEIFDFIESDNPIAAAKMDLLFENAANKAARFPHMGRPGQLPGTRELIAHPNYRVIYEIQDDAIYIHGVVHTARQWPPVDDGDA